jgi:hypothetical protein
MAYYTALSRSASAAGTIIIQGFDPRVITTRCSGNLRQEFREQEILDDITKLQYEGKLPRHMDKHLRNPLIRQYQKWKGTNYVPKQTDVALRWSPNDPLELLSEITDSPWQILDKQTKKSQKSDSSKATSMFVPAVGSVSVSKTKKHKLTDQEEPQAKKLKFMNKNNNDTNDQEEPQAKKLKFMNKNNNDTTDSPLGLIWDGTDYSCAYDALFVILYNIWAEKPRIWTRKFKSLDNQYLTLLVNGFKQVLHKQNSFEAVRDTVRSKLHSTYPTRFPMGRTGTSVVALAAEILRTESTIAFSQLICTQCQYKEPEMNDGLEYVLYTDRNSTGSTSRWVQTLHHHQQQRCPECLAEMHQPIFYNEPPCLLVLEYGQADMRTSHRLKIKTDEDNVELHLRGIAYHGSFHFTSRFISEKGDIWYHDGRRTGSTCIYDGDLTNARDSDLRRCRKRDLVLAVYA